VTVGRIFAHCLIVFCEQFFLITGAAHIMGQFFTDYALFMTKSGWATFWAIFSQTHLVALSIGLSV
jgi:hypothetical protein